MKKSSKRNRGDVDWWQIGEKRVVLVSRSTRAVSDSLAVISDMMKQDGIETTPNNIVQFIQDKHLLCYEEIKVMYNFICKGYGDEVLNIK